MTTRLLAFAGNKQSGKTTCSNFLHGYQLRSHNIINSFNITDRGELVVGTDFINSGGEKEQGHAILDVKRIDLDFAEWAAYNMWPYVKSYSFADPLKNIAIELFGIKEEQVFGTDIQKNTKTHLKWEDMPQSRASKRKPAKRGKMTAREFLQFFGTEICRKIDEEVWVSRLIKDVTNEGSLLALVDDCRFPNEAESIQNAGGKVVQLTRSNYKDSHKSENAFPKGYEFDAVIDNQNMSIQETHIELVRIIEEWGWLGSPMPEVPQEDEPKLVGGIHTIRGSE